MWNDSRKPPDTSLRRENSQQDEVFTAVLPPKNRWSSAVRPEGLQRKCGLPLKVGKAFLFENMGMLEVQGKIDSLALLEIYLARQHQKATIAHRYIKKCFPPQWLNRFYPGIDRLRTLGGPCSNVLWPDTQDEGLDSQRPQVLSFLGG